MNLKIEHIGIAVRDILKAEKLFSLLLKSESYKTETVESEKVNVSFFRAGETKIELLQATSDESPISRFIDKKGEGIHHLAFAVDDIHVAMKEMKEAGFELLMEEPKRGADDKLICFLHPRTTNGVLVELCQSVDSHNSGQKVT